MKGPPPKKNGRKARRPKRERLLAARRTLHGWGGRTPVEPATIDAKRMIEVLPNRTLEELCKQWRNALGKGTEEDAATRHASYRFIDAIEGEWSRRGALSVDAWFRWPSTDAPVGVGKLVEVEWPEVGMLKWLGYTVGHVNGESGPVRKAILNRVFIARLPPIVSADYLRGWGAPSSAARLQKMADSLASFARQAKRQRTPKDDAIADWEYDLRYLYDAYYVGRFGFAWPSTSEGGY
jgi:hypothetical protein